MITKFTFFNPLRPSDAYMRRYTNHHWFRKWLVAWTAPSHYLNHCWNIVNWALRNKFQWNFNRNSNIFIQENALENVVCEMASILFRPQCVNSSITSLHSIHIIAIKSFGCFHTHWWSVMCHKREISDGSFPCYFWYAGITSESIYANIGRWCIGPDLSD